MLEPFNRSSKTKSMISKDNTSYQSILQDYNTLTAYKDALTASGKGDPSLWSGIDTFAMQKGANDIIKYSNALTIATEREAKYLSGKRLYASYNSKNGGGWNPPGGGDPPNIDGWNLPSTYVKNTTKGLDTIENQLSKAAQEFANGKAIITDFKQSADGISAINFSVLDTATNSMRQFSMETGTLNKNLYLTETTAVKSVNNIQSAYKQLESVTNLRSKLEASGVNVSADNSSVAGLLSIQERLNAELAKGDNASQSMLAKLSSEAKLSTAEVEKLYKKTLQMKEAIASGNASDLGKVSLDGTKDSYQQLTQSVQDFANKQKDTTLSFGKFNKEAGTLEFTLTSSNGIAKTFTATMSSLNGQVIAQQKGVKQAATSWGMFKTDISKIGRQFMTAAVGYNVFYRAISTLRQGVTYVKEIDLALTELKKVTDEAESSYDKFLNTASEAAGRIGSTVSDFTDATANFARLGYSMSESAKMAESAIVYKNVADGLDTVEESTDSIISTMKAFGIESNDTMGIIDRFNEVKFSCLLIQ